MINNKRSVDKSNVTSEHNKTHKWVLYLVFGSLILGVAAPHFPMGAASLTLITQGTFTAIMATSVGLLIRQCGLISFGHATYFGLSAYTTALLLKHTTLHIVFVFFLAIATPTLLGLLMALVVVRQTGVTFSMLTLAVAQVFHEIILKWRDLAGGDDGMSVSLPPILLGLDSRIFQSASSMFTISWSLLTLILFGLFLMSKSRFGRLLFAIRDNEERTRFIGYDTIRPRVIIYSISCSIGALGGFLFLLYNTYVSPELLHWTNSGFALVMAIVGGAEFVVGPAMGALAFLFTKDLMGNLTEHWQSIMGVILILIIVWRPTGLTGALLSIFQGIVNLVRVKK
jgi:branched-chain amino acid transport system permease protein